MRVLHQGFREIRGVVGYLYVVLYEHSRKAVLIRVHDNAECRLYSHIVSLESLFGVEPSDEEEVHKVDILRDIFGMFGVFFGRSAARARRSCARFHTKFANW